MIFVLSFQEDTCSKRGLVENTEQQTFIMALPQKLRKKYDQVLLPAQLEVGLHHSIFNIFLR